MPQTQKKITEIGEWELFFKHLKKWVQWKLDFEIPLWTI